MQMEIKNYIYIHLFLQWGYGLWLDHIFLNYNGVVIFNNWIFFVNLLIWRLMTHAVCRPFCPLNPDLNLTKFIWMSIFCLLFFGKRFCKWMVKVCVIFFIIFATENSLDVLPKLCAYKCKEKWVHAWWYLRHRLKYKLGNYRGNEISAKWTFPTYRK